MDIVESLRQQDGEEEPLHRVEAALVRLLLRSRQVSLAADVRVMCVSMKVDASQQHGKGGRGFRSALVSFDT